MTKYWNYNICVQILYSYLRYTLLDVFFLLLALRETMRNQEVKIELQKKVHRRICVRDITFLAACPSSSVIFCRFFRLLRFYEEKHFAITAILDKSVVDFSRFSPIYLHRK